MKNQEKVQKNNSLEARRQIILVGVILLLGLFLIGNISAWWDNNWQNRIPIYIQENSGHNVINYAVPINITFDLKMQSDFDDLRFIDSTDTIPLDYWIESKIDNSWANIWVEVDSLTASINNTIYMYFGNPSVSTTNNEQNTFLFVEEFENGTYNNTFWDLKFSSFEQPFVNESLSNCVIGSCMNVSVYDNAWIQPLAGNKNYTDVNVKFYTNQFNARRGQVGFEYKNNPYSVYWGRYNEDLYSWYWSSVFTGIPMENYMQEINVYVINGTGSNGYIETYIKNSSENTIAFNTTGSNQLDNWFSVIGSATGPTNGWFTIDSIRARKFFSPEPTYVYNSEGGGGFLEKSQTFNYDVISGATESFGISLGYNSGFYSSVIGKLVYNGTEYMGSQTKVGNNIIFNKTISIPIVSIVTNVSFNWSITGIINSSHQERFNSSTHQQRITNLLIDNCVINTNKVLNYTLKDELTQSDLNGTIEVFVSILPLGSSTPILSYSGIFNNITTTSICINNSLTTGTLLLGSTVKYSSSGYQTEYNVIRYTYLNSTTLNQNISLLDLPTSSATSFKIFYKDTSYLPVSLATIDISRQYISEGVFKTVERPITDFDGKTSASLIKDTGIYNFYVYYNNILVANFLNVIPICQNPTITDCVIDLNSFSSSIPVNNFTSDNDFIFILDNNRTTRITTLSFSIPSGTVSTVLLDVTKTDALGTNVCSNSISTSSGTLTCTYGASIGNTTLIAKIYKDGKLVGTGHISLEQTPSQIYGGILIFLSIFILLTLVGASISDNPVFTIIMFMVGIILLFALNLVAHEGFIGTGATILWLIIAIILVLIKGSKRQ